MTGQSTTTRTTYGELSRLAEGSPMTTVGAYLTRSDDSELAQMLLWAAGIPYVIQADDPGGTSPFNGTAGMRLLVEERDADDARWALTHRPPTGKELS